MTASVGVGLFPPPVYEIPFEPFERASPHGTPEQVAEFVSPSIESPHASALAEVAFARAAPGDGPAIEAMLARCSPKSLSDRFFRPISKAPDGYLDQVLSNRDVHFVFLVQRHGAVIGLAELHRTGSHCGDMALIVEDAYHDRGIGTASLGLLIEVARKLDMHALNADVRMQNGVVLRALQRAGKTTVTRSCDICHVQVHVGSLKGERLLTGCPAWRGSIPWTKERL
jgi:N-acetylglutamate synthase-like GNAT family acetyltransferase